MTNKIVVVGSGIAGLSALKAIREVDRDSEITFLGEEKFFPYYRIKLSKYLFDELSEDKFLIQKKEWYGQNNINICLGNKVKRIDVEKREVILSDENVLFYDKLLLANGASNFKPPIHGMDLPGVFSLRALQDAMDIREQIEGDEQVIIIGGGIQGLETAWSLHKTGARVSIVELLPRIMPNQLDERASELLKQSIEKFEIAMLPNTRIERLSGNSQVEGIVTAAGEILPCKKVIYSVGIRPNVEIVQGTSIRHGKGILVNEKMETSVDHIYAAGDIAEFNNRIAGSWNLSLAQGKVAGYNIAGKDSVYQEILPAVTLNAFDLTLFSMGRVNDAEACHLAEESKEGHYTKISIKDDRIIGAIVIGDTKRSLLLKSAMEKGVPVKPLNYYEATVGELLSFLQS